MDWVVGTDVGGTFTDVWLRDASGRTVVRKAPTTADVVTGLLAGLTTAAAAVDVDLERLLPDVVRFGHGTTVGLNALLTGRSALTALLVTAGFGDVLEIGRLRRGVAGLRGAEVGDYYLRGRTQPLVPRHRVVEVPERIGRTGAVLLPLDVPAARRELDRLHGIEAVAVCLLWSTVNPDHELELAELVAELLPDAFISLSHQVAPAVGGVRPGLHHGCRRRLGARGRALPGPAGDRAALAGSTDPAADDDQCRRGAPRELARRPVRGLLSGPASGVTAGQAVGARLGRGQVLTLDVGGTSFDVGVVVDGQPLMRSEVTFGGADIRVPCIDVASIGAGGGSLAEVRAGVLTVGPRSAGAVPGPVCYGRGGTQPTATDADLVLGVIDPDRFAGGLRLDGEAAGEALERHVGKPLGLSRLSAARAVREVLDASMADLLHSVTVERGHDPREFTLVAGGGSGPSHAWVLCRELGLDGFLVPAAATAQSAYGAGTSPLRTTVERSCYLRLAPATTPDRAHHEQLAAAVADVRSAALTGLAAGPDPELGLRAAVRYRGQAHSLDVPLTADHLDLEPLLARFEAEYEALFGRGAGYREAGFEVLSVRATATRPTPSLCGGSPGEPLVEVGSRRVVFDDPGKPVKTPVYAGERPEPGTRLVGPCLVELAGCVVVVPPGGTVTADEESALHVKVNA